MVDAAGSSLDVGVVGSLRSLQAIDPTAIVGLSGPVRGVTAFVSVLLVGGMLAWRYEPFLERSIAASMERPIAAVGYGVAAHAVIAFAGVYLADQLVQLPTRGVSAATVGAGVGLLLVLVASGLGFTVVGASVVGVVSERRRWQGPVMGAALAGVVAALDPAVGWVPWFVLVSMGIGGPVRKWLHASEGPDLSGSG